ncbi:MAG TPA: hypothetical protein VNB06_14055 [Thermoanaerobaculia bacterium]|nr:hypothetical protein [Thermoanaerobaculia bacterium]
MLEGPPSLWLVARGVATSGEERPQGFRVPQEAVSTSENRTFYTGGLNWFYEAGTSGVLSMRGHDSTVNGGRITSRWLCLACIERLRVRDRPW